MPLFEFHCNRCDHRFEQINSASEVARSSPDSGRCPKCGKNDRSEKQISRFAVGGRGDLRETTVHGCHSYDGMSGGHSHDHDHDHDHSHDDSGTGTDGH